MSQRELRLAEQLAAERDRRYSEVAAEREKALKIKEQADDRALDLARTIQTYKDEAANHLREQINSERGVYATKDDLAALSAKIDATISPVLVYVSAQQGRSLGNTDTRSLFLAIPGVVAAIFSVLLAVLVLTRP